jgi:PAS domain-containing protein
MNTRSPHPDPPGREPDGAPPRDELDTLLRQWHAENAERAAAGRDALMARLAYEAETARQSKEQPTTIKAPGLGEALLMFLTLLRSVVMNRYSPVAATAIALVVVIAVLIPSPSGPAYAQEIMVPEGGRLDALDDEGNILGPCPLAHTDVDVQVSGFFSRVTVTQKYQNPYEGKIEAVYTFPLSHRAAVDRMTMTIGDRVVVGEVKEREQARRIYEAAREQGYVASLLEQERPNIFTQSVANIEPGAEVLVEISYVEVLESKDGTYSFDFPMVVGPRYIPGASVVSPSVVPAELESRQGLVLLGPAGLTVGAAGKLDELGSLQPGKLEALLGAAQPIQYPGDPWWGGGDATGGAGQPTLWYRFTATYCDGSKEMGELYTDGTGQLNGRWFYVDPKTIEDMGTGFGQDTNQVPDASRITPMPVKPDRRAGHDIAVSVTIDSGGPGLLDITSAQHRIVTVDAEKRPDGLARKATVTLAAGADIPNRDFVLTWRQTADTIQEATFTHTSSGPGEPTDGFFTLILEPPDRVADADVRPRELIFVMDTSGSMKGFPIDKSKAVMTRAISGMRDDDTFNVITFAGRTSVLWSKPRPATAANRAEAKAFVESRRGSGGTEMMAAIDAALVQPAGDGPQPLSPRALADLPADDRRVDIAVAYERLHSVTTADMFRIPLDEDLSIPVRLEAQLPPIYSPEGVTVRLDGRWRTEDGRRLLVADRVWLEGKEDQARPMRIVLFLTDGYVGNDMAIIDAVRKNADTTRVFSFGIGNSVNRYLLEGMARAGRGEVEFVLLDSDADEAVARFTKRIETPVLTDIQLAFSDGLDVADVLPSPDAIPDLFDAKPLVIQGRYRSPGEGTVTIRGRTGAGAYEGAIALALPEQQKEHDVIATLWARAKVDEVMAPHLQSIQAGNPPEPVRNEIVALGEEFRILTQYTSFVAVEKSRMTIGGKPVLVAVPIELPEGTSYEGFFGGREDKDALGKVALGQPVIISGDRREPAGKPPVAGGRGMGFGGSQAAQPGRRAKGPKRAAPGKGMPSQLGADRSTVHRGQLPMRSEAPPAGGGKKWDASGKAAGGFGSTALAPRPEASPNAPTQAPSEPMKTSAGPPAPAEAEGLSFSDQGAQADGLQAIVLDAKDAPVDAETATDALGSEAEQTILRNVEALYALTEKQDEAAVRDLARIPLVDDYFFVAGQVRARLGGRPVLAQDAAMLVAAFVREDRIDDARALAEKLARIRPDYPVAIQMRDVLTDESLEATVVAEKIAALGAQAQQEMKAASERWMRQRRLERVLGPDLRAMTEGRPTVTVLVDKVDDDVKNALTEAGLDIEDASESLPIVVGTVALPNLEKLALLDGVRRIERTRTTGL